MSMTPSTGGFGDPLDGDKPGSVTGSWDAHDSTTAGGTVDSGIGDSLSGAEVFWMGGSWDVFLGSIAVVCVLWQWLTRRDGASSSSQH